MEKLKDFAKVTIKTLIVIFMILFYVIKGIVLFFIPRNLRFKSVKDELVLITGGGSGLGRALALRLSKLGAKIIIWDIDQRGIDETIRLIKKSNDNGNKVNGFVVDVTDRKAVYSNAELIRNQIGKVTMLINNAGIVNGKSFLELDDDKIVRTFNVNSLSHFWTLKAFLPDMMANNHGHIVFVASVASYIGAVKLSDYCASKSAVVGLEESLRLELKHDGYDGIKSTAVCPYFINTGLFEGFTSNILPSLETDYVADVIIKGVLTNQAVIAIPKVFYLLHALKTILPLDALYLLYESLGGFDTMKYFTGRQQQQQQQQQQFNGKSLFDHNRNVKMSSSNHHRE